MQVGMNTNVHHQGKTLHIQTEDSGSQHGHVVTHIFLAGTIIATKKIEYESHISPESLQILIKNLHHEMMSDLKSGHYNKKIMLARPRRPHGDIPLARQKKTIKTGPSYSKVKQSESAEINPPEVQSKDAKGSEELLLNSELRAKGHGPWAIPKLNAYFEDQYSGPDDEESS
jgi:hypothetical protein